MKPIEKEQPPCHYLKRVISAIVRSPYFYLLLLFPVSLGLVFLFRQQTELADWYRETVYCVISKIGHLLSSTLPVSAGEILVLLLVPGLLAYLTVWIVRTIRAKGRRLRTCGRYFLRLLSAVSLVFFLYTANCGLNYYASDFASQSGLTVRKTSSQELYSVCVILAEQASELRRTLPEDEQGVMKLDRSAVFRKTADAVNHLHQTYDFLQDGYAEAKGVMLSRGLSELNITGIFFPFTWEANVNMDVPDYSIPSTMCHELTHLRGYMHEEDANFIAFLACLLSEDPELEYSGLMMGITYAGNELYRTDQELYWQFSSYLSEQVKRDQKSNAAYWKQFQKPIAKAASAVNDSYLKSNAQESGVKSYGQVVDLILAYYSVSGSPERTG